MHYVLEVHLSGLSKAFDTLSHCILLAKLDSYESVGIKHKWFSHYFYFNESNYVTTKPIAR